jgi:hypothetical protein
MERFVATFQPSAETRILDLGGTPANWTIVPCAAQITLLNRDVEPPRGLPPNFTYVSRDGRALDYDDEAFDLVFSNAVLEHVGTLDDQRAFAKEARRVGKGVWV